MEGKSKPQQWQERLSWRFLKSPAAGPVSALVSASSVASTMLVNSHDCLSTQRRWLWKQGWNPLFQNQAWLPQSVLQGPLSEEKLAPWPCDRERRMAKQSYTMPFRAARGRSPFQPILLVIPCIKMSWVGTESYSVERCSMEIPAQLLLLQLVSAGCCKTQLDDNTSVCSIRLLQLSVGCCKTQLDDNTLIALSGYYSCVLDVVMAQVDNVFMIYLLFFAWYMFNNVTHLTLIP